MNVLLVTFRLPGLDEPAYRRLAAEVAPKIAQAPGLLSKTWLADPATSTYGGLVLFDSRQALDAYLASEVIRELRTNPRLTEFSAARFDTLAGAGRLTKGLLPLAPGPTTPRPATSRTSGAPRVIRSGQDASGWHGQSCSYRPRAPMGSSGDGAGSGRP